MYVHGHALFICQLPNCNLFTQHAIYLMGETPLVNCGPRSILLHRIQSTAILVLLFSANNHLPHNTVNPLLQQAGEIDNLTVSLGQSTLVVLCRFHVGAGIPGVAPHYTPSPTTFTWPSSPTGSINLGFLLRENLLLYASHLPLGVPNGRVLYAYQALFLAPLPGRSRHAARGVSTSQSLYFVFVLLSFIYYFVCCTKSKYKKISC